MTAYFIRRFLLIIPTFLGITILIFVITRFVPGGPIERVIAQAQQQALEGGGAAVSETVFLRHVRLEKPLILKIDGRRSQCVVIPQK